ncbi:MAG: metallophosphoesterase [Duncaniella sp.]|nr:metallophosphoesterase [Duncaniella sp.]
MRLPMFPMIMIILVNLLVDSYIYRALKQRCRSLLPSRIQLWSALALVLLIVVTVALPRRNCSNELLQTVMWCLYTYFTFYIPKYVFLLIDLIARIPQLFGRKRITWLSLAGAVLAVLTFIAMWWGALINRYSIDINRVDVEIADLPEKFNGYTIAQISDLHVGTYGNDTSYVAKVVDAVKALHPDVVMFTGDIVNSKTAELEPHTSPLSRLDAPDGVFSILGNHDYGDYSEWPSALAKQENMSLMYELQKNMGWRLLLNETSFVRRGNDSIAIIGVENIGDPPFHVYGSLRKAYPQLGDSITKILLSHNPAHWVDSISGHADVNVPLTLSGHTHAMQMEVLGWSPAEYRYKTWGGLYSDDNQKHQLYVNIGVGTVAIPARIGATPEITLITLKKKN